MNRTATISLGVDIGGGTTRVALVRADGALLARRQGPTPAGGEPAALVALVEEFATALREEYSAPAQVANVIGVGLPGLYDRATGIVQRAVNLPALQGFALREALEERLRYPVHVDTDVIAAGWAQWRALSADTGAAAARFVYLSLGTGIGGAVILDRQIVRHTRGGAGHLGHLIVDSAMNAPHCRCGARGCLEQVVCGGLRERAAVNPPDGAAMGELARPLAIGLLQIVHLYAPTMIALGGGVSEHYPALVTGAATAFASMRSQLTADGMKIVRAPLRSDDAGVIGAALLAMAAGCGDGGRDS